VCFEIAASSKNIKYSLLNFVETPDIWLIPHPRNLTNVKSRLYSQEKRYEPNMLEENS
jgi:hypothetical protein